MMTSDLAGSSSSPTAAAWFVRLGRAWEVSRLVPARTTSSKNPKHRSREGEREKHGAKRVSLLDPTTRLHDIVGKEETKGDP